MKKLFIAALMMIGMTSFAQQGEPMRVNATVTAEQRNEMQMKRLAVELNLDANQEKEMTAILKEGTVKREVMNKEMDAKRAPSTQRTADAREKRKVEMQEFDNVEKAQLQKVLTLEQFTKFEKIRKEREAKMNASK
jgi:protein CpxP